MSFLQQNPAWCPLRFSARCSQREEEEEEVRQVTGTRKDKPERRGLVPDLGIERGKERRRRRWCWE